MTKTTLRPSISILEGILDLLYQIRKGWIVGMIFFIGNLFIPITIYFQLLAQNIYPIFMAMAQIDRPIDTGVDFKEFSYSYTCIIIFAILMALTSIRNLSVFVRLASYAVVFLIMLLIFIFGFGIYGFTNTEYVYNDADLIQHPDASVIYFVNNKFGPLMGILGGGYYLHNISLPIIRNAAKPENNVRDVFIGYFLVCFSYIFCGFFGYYGFSGKSFEHAPILSNCLLMFKPDNILAIIMRFCVFSKLLLSLSLLFACQRE